MKDEKEAVMRTGGGRGDWAGEVHGGVPRGSRGALGGVLPGGVGREEGWSPTPSVGGGSCRHVPALLARMFNFTL